MEKKQGDGQQQHKWLYHLVNINKLRWSRSKRQELKDTFEPCEFDLWPRTKVNIRQAFPSAPNLSTLCSVDFDLSHFTKMSFTERHSYVGNCMLTGRRLVVLYIILCSISRAWIIAGPCCSSSRRSSLVSIIWEPDSSVVCSRRWPAPLDTYNNTLYLIVSCRRTSRSAIRPVTD